jgi:hypothetical protein
MSFHAMIWLMKLEVLIFLGGLATVIAYRLLTGEINTKYLLYGSKKGGAKYFSPERVQLLLFTLGTAMFYISNVLQNRTSGALPDVPPQTLALLAGSHGIYLAGKAYMMLFKSNSKGE